MIEAVIFAVGMLTLTIAILVVIYGIVRDVPPPQMANDETGDKHPLHGPGGPSPSSTAL